MPLYYKSSENYLFDEKIRYYEDELVKFSLEIGKRRGQNPIITKIFTYLLIHKELTQKQLLELCECSLGSISTHLAALVSLDLIERKLIPRTHTNIYTLKYDLNLNLSALINLSIKYINQAKQFLTSKKKELYQLLERKRNKDLPIKQRFEELESVILFYEKLFEIFINPNIELKFEFKMKKTDELDSIPVFDPDLEEFERAIIEFFTNTPIFFGKQEIFSKTFAYFITRKTLNQKKLKILTGLSSGKISQEINNLLDIGVIEIIHVSETGLITYQMQSIISTFVKISYNILSEYLNWKNRLDAIMVELEAQKKRLANLTGYKDIVEVTKLLLKIMPFYEKSYHAVSRVKEKLEIS